MFKTACLIFALTASVLGQTNLQALISLADSGDAQAQVDLGLLYETGEGVETNRNEAVRLYRLAAEQGLAEAQNNLGICYRKGQGVETNFVEAVKWFGKAADQGYAKAQYSLGLRYQYGEGVETNAAKAFELYTASANQGYDKGQYKLARCYSDEIGTTENNTLAVEWLKKSAAQGYASAQNSLGYHYEKGYGITKDYNQAAKYYRLAAEQGNATAQANLGYCYYKGRGVEKNLEASTRWYKKAADQGYARGEYNYGYHLLLGRGIEKNEAEGVNWIRKAADKDYGPAVKSMVYRYEKGEGVEKDLEEAERWYERALELGYDRNLNKQKKLEDYEAIFTQMNKRLKTQSKASTEEMLEWMQAAINAKDKLNLEKDIDPWLEELASAYPDSRNMLHAIAMGYHEAAHLGGYHYIYEEQGRSISGDETERNRLLGLRHMAKAYALAEAERLEPSEMASLVRDYLIILLKGRDYELKLLKLKTTDFSEKEVASYTFGRELSNDPVFFNRPADPALAKNDGELIMALLGRFDITHEEARFPKEAQLPLARAILSMLGNNQYHESLPDWNMLHQMADDEYLAWIDEKPMVKKLPREHVFIPALEALVEKSPEVVGTVLSEIFKTRCQLERAARVYERAGDTNAVRSICANQGTFTRFASRPAGLPVRISYNYRNGTSVNIETFRVNVGSNLIERLEREEVQRSELNLLKGSPSWFRECGGFEKEGMLEKSASSTVALTPLSDHRDTTQTIDLGTLEAGTYLVRAHMENGNTAETVVNVRDTMIYAAPTPSPVMTNAHTLFILCDARTGAPKPKEPISIFDLSGGKMRDKQNKLVDTPYCVDTKIDGITDENGCYVLEDRMLTSPKNEIHIIAEGSRFPIILKSSHWHRHQVSPLGWSFQSPFIATDRPIYRLGDTGNIMIWQGAETNHFKLRIREDRSKFELPITGDPNLQPNRFGAMQAAFTVPKNARLGEYEIQQTFGEEHGFQWGELRVEEYRSPEFSVKAKQLDDGKIKLSATYAYGAPVAGGQASVQINLNETHPAPWYPSAPFDGLWRDGYWWNGDQFDNTENVYKRYHFRPQFHKAVNLTLDENGEATVDLSTLPGGKEAMESTGWIDFHATVMDAAFKEYETTERFSNNMADQTLCCWAEKAFFEQGEHIIAHTDSKTGNPATLHYQQISGTNTTDIGEMAPTSSGLYQVKAVDAEGAESTPFRFFVLGAAAPELSETNPIRVVVEKGIYDANETATILVQVDQPGRHVYFFDRLTGRNAYCTPQTFVMDKTSKRIRLPLNGDAGEWQCGAMTVVDGRLYAESGKIRATEPSKKTGTIEISTDRKTYQPGAKVTVKLRAANSSGKGEPCAIAVTVYNKMLDTLVRQSSVQAIYDSLFSTWIDDNFHNLRFDEAWPSMSSPTAPSWVMKSTEGMRSGVGGRRIVTKSAGGSVDDLFGDSSGDADYFGATEIAPAKSGFFSSYGMGKPMGETFTAAACYSATERNSPIYMRKDLGDSAYWNAFVETDENGEAIITFEVPDRMTEWKISGWAVHTNFAASGESSFTCAKDLVVQLNLPRFMTEGDELELSTSIRNHTTNALTIEANCSVSDETPTIKTLEPTEEKLVYWPFKAQSPGTNSIDATITTQTLSDGVSKPLPILPRNMLKRGGESGIILPENPVANLKIEIPETTDPSTLALNLKITPNMLETVAGALPYLAEYPHGCTEQTLNRFLPAVIVLQTLDKLELQLEDGGVNMPLNREAILDRKQIIKRAQSGIKRLQAAQGYNGSWEWNLVSSHSDGDPLVTAWVTRGLKRAAELDGLAVNKQKLADAVDDMVERLISLSSPPWRRKRDERLTDSHVLTAVVLQELGPEHYLTQKYDLDAVVKLMPEIGPFLKKHSGELSLYGKVLLAYYFELRGETDDRDQLMHHIAQYIEHNPDLGTYWIRVRNDQWWRWYNDEIEIMAWYLKLLNRTDPNGETTAGVARWLLVNRRYGDHWKSTRDTAICLEALCEYIANHPHITAASPVNAMLNGESAARGLRPGSNSLKLRSSGKQPVFYDVTWQFRTRENPIKAESCELVQISRSHYRIDPELDARIEQPINSTDILTAGETVEVELTLHAPQELEYLLATDRRPAGFETIESESGFGGNDLRYYMEIHNERVAFYINSLPKGESRITYRLRAEHAGTVSALPATVELMYAPDQAANSKETKLKVVR